jgi:hypothetical protein
MRRLASFDDAMLHDIGLARSEIEDAVRHGRACASRGGATITRVKASGAPSSA